MRCKSVVSVDWDRNSYIYIYTHTYIFFKKTDYVYKLVTEMFFCISSLQELGALSSEFPWAISSCRLPSSLLNSCLFNNCACFGWKHRGVRPVHGQVWTFILFLVHLWGRTASYDRRRFKGNIKEGRSLLKTIPLKKKLTTKLLLEERQR